MDLSLISPFLCRLLDGIDQGVALFDDGGRLVCANAAARRWLGDLGKNGRETAEELAPEMASQGGRITTLELVPGVRTRVMYLPPATEPVTLVDNERKAIIARLESTGWKLAETARQLGISRTTLWRRLRQYGLDAEARRR